MKLVEISIRRFQPDTPLTRDTFLFLPLNNKTIRIALAGEAISEPMLARILAKGHTHLRVAEESEIDPDKFAVHVETPAAPAPAPAAEPITADAGLIPPQTEASAEPQTLISPDLAQPEPSTLVAGSQEPAPEEPSAIAVSAEEEASQSFTASPSAEEAANLGKTELSSEDEVHLGAVAEEKDPESRVGGFLEEEAGEQTISGSEEPEEKYVRKFAAEKEALSAVIRLQKKMMEAKDNELSIDLTPEKEQALKEARTVILSSKISEKIISFSEQARTAEPSIRDTLRGQVRSLKNALDQVDNGDLSLEEKAEFETKEEISAVVEGLASASRAEQVEEITERLSAHALTKELAMAALEEQESLGEKELSRSATSRDLPATVSRLAAYLGHSLGYTNVDFLADLACGAIAHFAKKEGETLNEDLLPPFARRIISSDESPDDTVTDSRDILQFLDAYIDDKECDRSHKDLLKRVFDRTMKGFSEKEDGPSPWSLRKWESFVSRGPTMDSHSICTRASARAVKYARSAVK